MDESFQLHDQAAAAYFDIVIDSKSWNEHLEYVTTVFQALKSAGLIGNPTTCHLANQEVTYLGYIMRRVCLCLLMGMVQALVECSKPTMKRLI